MRTTYSDGGQHATFAALLRKGAVLGEVSRPEALAFAGLEVVQIPARRRPVLVAETPRPVPLPVIETEPSLFARTPLAEGPTRLTLAGSAMPAKTTLRGREPDAVRAGADGATGDLGFHGPADTISLKNRPEPSSYDFRKQASENRLTRRDSPRSARSPG